MTRASAQIDQKQPVDGDRQGAALGPQRRCLASGTVASRGHLLRFVVGPDGQLVFDAAAKLPGRGLWVAPRRALIERAAARGQFAKAAKRPVLVPADLADQVESALRGGLLELLGLARRAGVVTLGFEKTRARLTEGAVAVLFQASDAAAGGRDKLRALGRGVRSDLPVVELFTVAQLSGALGRENAVHVAVSPSGLADRITVEAERLGGVIRPQASLKGC